MTTLTQTTVQCGACAHLSPQSTVSSTNSYGPADLDGRPSPMARQAIMHLQECPNCGSIGTRISYCETPPDSEKIQNQLEDFSSKPELARYAQAAIQSEVDGYLSLAKRHWIMAAWAADDLGEVAWSKEFRKHYICLSDSPQEYSPGDKLALVDALRRSEQFDRAIVVASEFLKWELDPKVRRVLRFQKQMSNHGDVAIYRFDAIE